jgi:hypothetical protein
MSSIFVLTDAVGKHLPFFAHKVVFATPAVIVAFLDMQTERQASYPSSLLLNLQSCLLQS